MSLHALAEAAGIARHWKDVHGQQHEVGDDTLRTVLAALGLAATSLSDIAASLHSLQAAPLPPLLTAEAGGRLEGLSGAYELLLEDGGLISGQAEGGITLPDAPGYHRLRIGGGEVTVAAAPGQCWSGGLEAQPWGLAVQLYALRRPGDGGLGDFGGLAEFVRSAAAHGAACVAISPAHAQFSATLDRFSPYSPSSRTLLNVLHAKLDLAGEEAAALEAAPLVDWPAASRLRRARMDALFAASSQGGAEWDAFTRFRAQGGGVLEGHARFEALHEAITRAGGPWHWRDWPDGLADAQGAAVAAWAGAHAQDVARHAYFQFLADQGLAEAQAASRSAGMAIGLVSDLAVGVDSGGSQCWAAPGQMLPGLTVGAPPDLLNTKGQSWGLATFSPRGLQQNGFAAYIDMLRAAMRHAGGVRIDHAMGLARLWVLPDGASPAEGAYLHFPVDDMLRLVRLESLRHRSIVLGEDLGTLPDGFQGRISAAGMLGMRVLWFERAQDEGFIAPEHWDRGAASMTSTHDLATVAGWWSGTDTAWRERIGLLDTAGVARESGERGRDRLRLWSSMVASGAAAGEAPPAEAPARAVDAAVRHVGLAACALSVVPVEDVLGLAEQPNLPGTLDEHPNWRRRLPGEAATLLDAPDAAARLDGLAQARNSSIRL